MTVIHQNEGRTESYKTQRQAEAAYLQYLCRNFPRAASWHLSHWSVNCIQRSFRSQYTRDHKLALQWDEQDDRSTVVYAPPEVRCFIVIPSRGSFGRDDVHERDRLRRSWLRHFDEPRLHSPL